MATDADMLTLDATRKTYTVRIVDLISRCNHYDMSPLDPAYFQDAIDGEDEDIGSGLGESWWLNTVLAIMKEAEYRGCFAEWDMDHPMDDCDLNHASLNHALGGR